MKSHKNILIALTFAMAVISTSYSSHHHPPCPNSAYKEHYAYKDSCAEAKTEAECKGHFYILGSHDPGMAWHCDWGQEVAGGNWCGNILPCLYDHGLAHREESSHSVKYCSDGHVSNRTLLNACTDHSKSCDTFYVAKKIDYVAEDVAEGAHQPIFEYTPCRKSNDHGRCYYDDDAACTLTEEQVERLGLQDM